MTLIYNFQIILHMSWPMVIDQVVQYNYKVQVIVFVSRRDLLGRAQLLSFRLISIRLFTNIKAWGPQVSRDIPITWGPYPRL